MVLELPRKNMVFDPKRGKIYSKRNKVLLISIKDPFLKEINYGKQLQDKEKLRTFIGVLKSFMKSAAL